MKGTTRYAAPEIAGLTLHKPLPFKVDIYSLGLTICYLMLKEVPSFKTIKKKEIVFPSDYSKEL